MSINLKQKITSLLVCVVVSLLLTKFFQLSPTTRVIGDGYDSYEYLTFQNLVKENLLASKYPLSRTDTLRYPSGFDLSYGYDGAFSTFTGALISFFIPQPLAYNLTLIIILTLNLWCSFLFFVKLSPNLPSAFISSLIFGGSPYVLARLGSHANLAFVAGFPLLAQSILSFIKKINHPKSFRLTDFLYPMLSVLIIAFGSLQYLLILLYSSIVIIPLIFLIFPQQSFVIFKQSITVISKNILRFFFSTLIFSLIFTFFYQGYIRAILTGQLVHDPAKITQYRQYAQPGITDIILINSYQNSIWSKFNSSPPSIEKVISLGLIGWILLLISILKKPFIRFRLVILFYFLYFALSALGFFALPFFPEGGRQIIIFSFLAATLLALTPSFSKPLSLFILFLLIIERSTLSPISTPILSLAAREQINRLPGFAILNLPTSKYTAYYSHIPAVTNKKIVDGYFHYMADNPSANTFLSQDFLRRFICQSEKPLPEDYQITPSDSQVTLDLLKSNGIRTIMLHKNSKFLFDECTGVRQWWYTLYPKTEIISTQNQNLQVKNFEFNSYPKMSLRFFAQDPGVLTIHGLLIYPNILNDTYLLDSGLSSFYPTWENDPGGIKTTSDFLHHQSLSAGESFYIRSDTLLNQTAYLTVWYTFTGVKSSPSPAAPIEFVYEDTDVQIYKIN
ncbi:MAG: hypothetical protein WC841_04750 [Candidatus Shapirobacteria bacterium]